MSDADVAIVGGGIIGLATAHAILSTNSACRVVVLEKERRVAAHQSGRNSGVLHSGIYYRPGSLKARLATTGRATMVSFCAEHGVPFEVCGKLVVALDERERARMHELHARADANGVRTRVLDGDAIRSIEPHVQGVAALHVPETGLADFEQACSVLAELVVGAGAEVRLEWPVERFVTDGTGVRIQSERGDIVTRCAVNCAGLFSDVLARRSGAPVDLRIVPFRGEYLEVVPEREALVTNMIYPVPDPMFPFLGVHLTRGIDGRVHAGPNAVLALAREGYSWRQVDWRELGDLARFPGIRKLARRYWRTGAHEIYRSVRVRALARALQRLVPDIRAADLVPIPAGVRAQALGRDGDLIDDFVIHESGRAIHVLNAPSPAATASLEIGREIAHKVKAHLA
jgi:(S)-2-hydroxyglutarate dehydrogenase